MSDVNKIKYSDESTLLFLIQLFFTEINKYVLKVDGKGLSQEDFTTTLKNKLDGIDLSKYSTTEQMTQAINQAVGQITGISFDGPYASLAALKAAVPTGSAGVIYLVSNGGTEPDTNDEYYWNSKTSKYEFFGTTKVDLSACVKYADLTSITQDEVNTIWTSVFG